jgi:hypothetical protein
VTQPAKHLRDQAAALAGELIQLKTETALAADHELNVRLKEVRRIIKSFRGEPFSEDAYERLKERLTEELYGETDSEEQVILARKESLKASMRRTIEAELAAERTELEAVAEALHERELAVTARERKASPPYRARFAAAGAGLVLAVDVLIRVVA